MADMLDESPPAKKKKDQIRVITRLHVENFRSLRELDFEPKPSMNILVGDNQAGKSTLLEAITLVLTGRSGGRRVSDELNPYWFNRDAVEEFYRLARSGVSSPPPEILIEAYLDKGDEPQVLRGMVNKRREDCPGLRLSIALDPDFQDEFSQYVNGDGPRLIPTEYYTVRWSDFRDKTLGRRPPELGISFIDGRTYRSNSGVDHHTRQMLAESVGRKEGASISVALRKSRDELTRTALAGVNGAIKSQTQSVIGDLLELSMDQSSASSWETSVIPQVDRIPFSSAGQGQQVMIKAALALLSSRDKSSFVLVEEPENHLSHTGLRKLVSSIEKLSGGRQTFVVTHSSYVMNRLGLNSFHLMHQGRIASFNDLSEETVQYFKKLSGFDTLRVVLAERAVILEGPSDELLFERAYKDATGRHPQDDGIDIITFGIQYKRPLELCKILNRKVAILRDVDRQTPAEWRRRVQELLAPGQRELFVGDPADGATLEPQVVSANANALSVLANIVGADPSGDLAEHMTDLKTESALLIADSPLLITYPPYFYDAIDFIHP